jgi:uncharacterized protein (DUF1778 family)
MMATGARDARLNFRLPTDLKEVIEEAAATLGQSVSDEAEARSNPALLKAAKRYKKQLG